MSAFAPRGLIVALQFLTRIPTPELVNFTDRDQSAAAVWYPVVGLIIGCAIAATAWIGAFVSPWFGALLAVVAWTWITGGLHLDGLADVADGLGAAHRDSARFLEVVKDPHVGSFGAIALILVLAGKLILLAEMLTPSTTPTTLAALILIPGWARWGPLLWRNIAPALGTGRGSDFAIQKQWPVVIVCGGVLAALSGWFAPALLIALVTSVLVPLYWRWRLGGMSGDCHGASIEITEVLLLASIVAFAGATP